MTRLEAKDSVGELGLSLKVMMLGAGGGEGKRLVKALWTLHQHIGKEEGKIEWTHTELMWDDTDWDTKAASSGKCTLR